MSNLSDKWSFESLGPSDSFKRGPAMNDLLGLLKQQNQSEEFDAIRIALASLS